MGSEQLHLIRTLSSVLERLLSPMRQADGDGGDFCAATRPAIPLRQYLERITKYAPFADEILLIAIIYMDRFQKKGRNIVLNHFNVHRLLLTSILIAVKFYSDVFYSNSYFARVGGLPGPEMNQLERVFLGTLQFDLIVQQDEFQLYQNEIRRHMADESSQTTPSAFSNASAANSPRSSSWAPSTTRHHAAISRPKTSHHLPHNRTSSMVVSSGNVYEMGVTSYSSASTPTQPSFYTQFAQVPATADQFQFHSAWRSASSSPVVVPASAYSPYGSCKSSSTENLQRLVDAFATSH